MRVARESVCECESEKVCVRNGSHLFLSFLLRLWTVCELAHTHTHTLSLTHTGGRGQTTDPSRASRRGTSRQVHQHLALMRHTHSTSYKLTHKHTLTHTLTHTHTHSHTLFTIRYAEPAGLVMSRSGDECVVALCDQVGVWFMLQCGVWCVVCDVCDV